MNTATTTIHPSIADQLAWELNEALARIVVCELWHRHTVATEMPHLVPDYEGITFAEIAAGLVPHIAPHFSVADPTSIWVDGDRASFISTPGSGFPLPDGWVVYLTLLGLPALPLASRIVMTLSCPSGQLVVTQPCQVQATSLMALGGWESE
jgi:hypothetical protein